MQRINQRFFLKIISLGIAIFAFSGFNGVAESKTRPNILIYIADVPGLRVLDRSEEFGIN